jgi:hypothetical protein
MFDKKSVPEIAIREGVSGNVKIEKLGNIYSLYVDDEIFMDANTKSLDQIAQLYSSYDLAYGDVLLTGLGFGILPLWIASKPEVKSVTVIERSQGVVDLFLANNSIPSSMNVEVSDVYEYKTDKNYDCIFLDHYEQIMLTPEQAAVISENIPNHNVFWFWAIELLIKETSNWDEVRSAYKVKLPDLSESKLQEYLDTYPKQKGYPLPQLENVPGFVPGLSISLDIS